MSLPAHHVFRVTLYDARHRPFVRGMPLARKGVTRAARRGGCDIKSPEGCVKPKLVRLMGFEPSTRPACLVQGPVGHCSTSVWGQSLGGGAFTLRLASFGLPRRFNF